MRGWAPDGSELELTGQQAGMVRKVLTWTYGGRPVTLPTLGRGSGREVVLSTIAEYLRRGLSISEPPRADPDPPSVRCGLEQRVYAYNGTCWTCRSPRKDDHCLKDMLDTVTTTGVISRSDPTTGQEGTEGA